MFLYKTEESIISEIKKGNVKLLNSIYKDNFSIINHFVLSNNGSVADAKDLFQEAMIIFYEKIMEDNLVLTCKISTYIYSVARRLWLRKLATKKKYVFGIDDISEFISIDDNEDDFKIDDFNLMSTALTLLGEPCKTIIEDFYIHNLNMNEITAKFGYTNADNAKNQKYKCLMRLKKYFFKKN